MLTHRKKTTRRRAAATSLAALLLGACVTAPRDDDRPGASRPQRPAEMVRLHRPDADDPSTYFAYDGLGEARLADLGRRVSKPSEWAALFEVYVGTSYDAAIENPPVLGAYSVVRDVVRFIPRFPLMPGLTYQVVYDPVPGRPGFSELREVVAFTIEKPAAPATTRVTHVYPSPDRLPENQLKFYLHFSAPMSQGEAYEHVHLFHSSGREVDYPFLKLGEELWNPAGTRFTLFIDPGRIKRGLKPREEFGPVLEAGNTYTLVIDADWPDAAGNPLVETHRKTFQVGSPDEQVVDAKTWRIEAPRAATKAPLALHFPEPLDHAMLGRVLVVTDAAGDTVAGRITVSRQETHWQFTPERPWAAGDYHIVVDTTLEDLAGNSIGQPFEVDVVRPIERRIETRTVSVPFQVVAGAASR